ncbi:MAG: deoxyguanosinetriphosphate triphosphohydrolase [Candidatus Ozemobacteraceae bacterium]
MTEESIHDDSIRRRFEADEAYLLAPRACFSSRSRGRTHEEHDCFIRTCFQRDTDRIIHSEAFRRLKHKTQVFLSPSHDHFRTRMTHTLEVAATARCIARSLRLNEDLTEAISYGHDLGHTPFGHAGEQVLAEFCIDGFHHAAHSARVVTTLEKRGVGLNLTAEVIDGILKHSKGRKGPITVADGADAPLTLEAEIVRVADLVAYINHDLDDALRAGLISPEDLPEGPVKLLGERHSKRIHAMVKDIIGASWEGDRIGMSPDVWQATEELRAFLYEKVYPRPEIESQVETSRKLLRQMAHWFMEHPEDLFSRMKHRPPEGQALNRTVTDFLAGMTDAYAITTFKELFVPDTHLDRRFFSGKGR